MFADQFEADRNTFLYRKSMKGPPIRVSQVERDQFVEAFNERLRYAAWSIFPATAALIGLLVWFIPDVDSTAGTIAVYVGISLILAPFLVVFYWAWNSPARELARRPKEGAARSGEEVRKLMFSKISYGQLGFAALAALALVWKVSAHTDVLHGWGLLWPAIAALMIVALAVQAFRKWRIEQR